MSVTLSILEYINVLSQSKAVVIIITAALLRILTIKDALLTTLYLYVRSHVTGSRGSRLPHRRYMLIYGIWV